MPIWLLPPYTAACKPEIVMQFFPYLVIICGIVLTPVVGGFN